MAVKRRRKKIIAGSAKASRRRERKKASAIQARRKREFSYRGFSLEELQEMSFDDVLSIIPARARRTYVRGLNQEQQACFDKLSTGDGLVRTHRRDLPILPQFVGRSVAIYDGKEFREIEIKPEMIGHFLGEFVLTRKSPAHSGPGVGATRSSKFMPLK